MPCPPIEAIKELHHVHRVSISFYPRLARLARLADPHRSRRRDLRPRNPRLFRLHRREEAAQKVPLRPIADEEMDSAKWAENYPREYDSYRRMDDSSPATKTKYGGASKRDYLAADPATVILFAGSSFDKEYDQAHGHTMRLTM